MSYLLLLGAGFSRNWGGWLASEAFEYLLGANEIVRSQRLRNLLWAANARGDGFEGALSDLQSAFDQDGSIYNGVALDSFEREVTRMLADMNVGFLQRVNFEFSNQVESSVGRFLARFDAIFTLNQDLLLERHYLSNDGYFMSPSEPWDGPSLPGMRAHRTAAHTKLTFWSGPTWVPAVPKTLIIPVRTQPYVKLHGSANWRTPDGDRLLVAGGNKVRTIVSLQILRLYLDEFERRLSEPATRLMTIGYGFREGHINDAIKRACRRSGLRLYIVDPRGTDAVRARPAAVGGGRNRDDPEFDDFICGASRRPLSVIFGGDAIEHAKLMRFFEI
jgi:hypothetical protein